MTISLIVTLGVFGALLGSFGCAQVWRLRARQLVEDRDEYDRLKQAGESPVRAEYYDPKELGKIQSLIRPVQTDRSECLNCHHQLAWYDLIPMVSWLSLRGRCRYCKKSIGPAEMLSEIGLAVLYIVSYLAWPHPLTQLPDLIIFVVWLVACLLMLILFIYDTRWSLLPFKINIALILVSSVFAVLSGVFYGWNVPSLIGAVALLAGLYAVFAIFKWSGFGDSILGLGLALLIGDWQLAFLALFLANILGCLMLLPLYLQRKLHRHLRVPFGPFLIGGSIIALLWGTGIITWFTTVSGTLFIALML